MPLDPRRPTWRALNLNEGVEGAIKAAANRVGDAVAGNADRDAGK